MSERDDYSEQDGPPPWRPPHWLVDLLAVLIVIAAIFQTGLFLNRLGYLR
jgi:hypothetical protein